MPAGLSDTQFDLTDRVALVTGGAGYLGAEVCRGLLLHGAKVVIADIDQTRANRTADQLNSMGFMHQSRTMPLDIAREDSIRGLIDRVRSDYGSLNILVNMAFTQPQGKSLDELTRDDLSRELGANVSGSFLLAREARRLMCHGGSIVMFSSMYGRVSPDPRVYEPPMKPNPIEYGAAKAAMEQMIRYLAVAWAHDGTRVNGIAPGPFPNPQVQEKYPDFVERLAQKSPMGRIGRATEVAGAVVFLASDAASYMTGQTLAVDGGWTVW
jgi:NAD(P)-dependent dehydrogenase (short-subunit alcohol dehydrogenase family)